MYYYLSLSFSEIGMLSFIMFIVGTFYWTFFEYILHRFLFHSEQYLPDNRYFITVHYLIHGLHHVYPMDNLRLVFPPALGIIMSLIFKSIYNLLFPLAISHAFWAGKLLGYIYYDLFHYFSHHAEAEFGYYAFMKSYHLAHHYKSSNAGFGVSNHFWDLVFNTEIQLKSKKSQID